MLSTISFLLLSIKIIFNWKHLSTKPALSPAQIAMRQLSTYMGRGICSMFTQVKLAKLKKNEAQLRFYGAFIYF